MLTILSTAPKKDKKAQKMQLGEFLTDTCELLHQFGDDLDWKSKINTTVALGSWADEMEDMPVACKWLANCSSDWD